MNCGEWLLMWFKSRPSAGHDGFKRCRIGIPASLLALVIGLGLAACSKSTSQGQRYELQGTVVAVNPPHHLITVAHEDIPGLMSAMTMPFVVKDQWVFAAVKPGDRIAAVLVVDQGASWLEQVVVSHTGAERLTAAKAEVSSAPEPGDLVPDFSLVNQYGRLIRLHQYRGSVLLLTFIYTRCPLPDYCPLMTRNFAAIERELRQNGGAYPRTRLLSVSIDPAYDAPTVLRKYGLSYTGSKSPNPFDQWEFATGSRQEIKSIAGYFGLDYWPEGNQIVHSLRTAVISPDGGLLKLYSGNQWKPADLLRDLASLK